MKYIFLALCLINFYTEAASFNFDNQPAAAYHIDETLQISGKANGISTKGTMVSAIDFDLTLHSIDEATVTVTALENVEKGSTGAKTVTIVDSKNPKNKQSKLFKQAREKLVGTPLHFTRNPQGEMIETTGLLAEVEELLFDLDNDPMGTSTSSFNRFFQQLLHLNGEELQANKVYAAQLNEVSANELLDNDAVKNLNLKYQISKVDNRSIMGTYKGLDSASDHGSKAKMNLIGTVSWDAKNPLIQQRTITVNFTAAILETKSDTISLKGILHQNWKATKK